MGPKYSLVVSVENPWSQVGVGPKTLEKLFSESELVKVVTP